MQIELEQYQNGKPLVLNANQDIAAQINILRKAKRYKELNELAEKLPCNQKKYLIKSNALLHMKDWEQLIKCCDRGIQISQEGQFYNLKGKAVGKLGDHLQKVQLLKKAIHINKKVAAYHRNLGAAYYSIKQYKNAIQQHVLAIQLQPTNPINYHNKGAALFRMNEFQQAKIQFQKAIHRDEKLSLSYSWMGDCQKQLKNYIKAADLYEKAYEFSNNIIYLREKQKLEQQHNLTIKKKKFFGLFG